MALKERLASALDVFSRRKSSRGLRYSPDTLADTLRQRILLLYRDVISGRWKPGDWSSPENHSAAFWDQLHNLLEHAYGRPRLSNTSASTQFDDVLAFLLGCSAAEFFDFIELSFKTDCMWRVIHDRNELVEAINEVFRVENAPYLLTPAVTVEEPDTSRPYSRGTVIRTVALPKVIRAEDEATSREAITPALSVLAGPDYEAANLEFRDALEEYRRGHYGDSLAKCCSAFESVMKVLCSRNRWPFDDKRDTAATLLGTILANSSLDRFFEQPLVLIATMRNRLSSAHGGGGAVRSVPRHVAQYALNSTASAILLLTHECGV